MMKHLKLLVTEMRNSPLCISRLLPFHHTVRVKIMITLNLDFFQLLLFWFYVEGLCVSLVMIFCKISCMLSVCPSILTRQRNVHFTFMWIYSKQMRLFNNTMRRKEIHSMLIYADDNAAYPNYESHIINISRVYHSHFHHSTSLSHWTDQFLNCYEYQGCALLSRPLA